jgi:hypothetical protein
MAFVLKSDFRRGDYSSKRSPLFHPFDCLVPPRVANSARFQPEDTAVLLPLNQQRKGDED